MQREHPNGGASFCFGCVLCFTPGAAVWYDGAEVNTMARIQWELFWRILTENPRSCDEVEGRIDGEYTIFGYLREYREWRGGVWKTVRPERPFWIGDCDVPDGAGFLTAEELVNAPVFGGKSMREIWPLMEIDGAAGMPVEVWMEQQHITGIQYDEERDLYHLHESTEENRDDSPSPP